MTALNTSALSDYLLTPASPLVFGSGKPLDFGLGGDCLDFPFPPTLAGALRAAAASITGHPDPFADAVKALELSWLALARVTGDKVTLAFAVPADVVYFGGKPRRVVLPADAKPVGAADGPLTDLDIAADGATASPYAGLRLTALQPPTVQAGAATSDLTKPDADAPHWWSAEALSAWLSGADLTDEQARGIVGPATARRTHVVIDGKTAAADPGGLFRSTALDFAAPLTGGQAAEYALAARFAHGGLDGLARRVGGEGRFAKLEKQRINVFDTALPPAAAAITGAQTVRAVLLTPALFPKGGWCPDGTVNGKFVINNVCCSIMGVALGRAQVFSGWQAGGKPGTPYRVVPAGTVYWLQIESGNPQDLHLQSLCAPDQARDGWGRVAVGVNVTA